MIRPRRHSKNCPRRHPSQYPQCPPYQPTPARSPAFHSGTPAPTSSITPTTSWPGTRGYVIPGQCPSFVSESLWHRPHACTLIRTSPAPGRGTGRSTNSNAPPALPT